MYHAPLRAALVDVGGTLWPDRWVLSEQDQQARVAAVRSVLPRPDPEDVEAAVTALTALVDEGPGSANRRRAVELIGDMLRTRGWAADPETVRAVRRALCGLASRAITPFAGAGALLAGLKASGLRCVILSNTTYRDAEVYGQDFTNLGWHGWVDGCMTSIDAGCAKPDPRIFRLALDLAEAAPAETVMIGDSEDNDILPARQMGLRTVRVGIEARAEGSAADVTVSSLTDALAAVRSWALTPRDG